MGVTRSPTVIFIASEGRSGSTLLDFLIGSHSDVVSGGELIDLQSRGSTRKDGAEQCTCGASITVCEHWRAVNAELRSSTGQSIDTLALHSPDADVFRRDNVALFCAISTVSQCHFVVDSSKRYFRLARLLAIPELDVRVIHLVRHPGGVAYSHIRTGGRVSFPSYGLGFSYLRGELRILRVLSGQEHHVVRYEDLVRDPATVLAKLMNWLGLAYEPAQLEWSETEHHSIGGNSMRFARNSTISPDVEWKQKLGTFRKMLISAVTLPVRQPQIARLVTSGRPTVRSAIGDDRRTFSDEARPTYVVAILARVHAGTAGNGALRRKPVMVAPRSQFIVGEAKLARRQGCVTTESTQRFLRGGRDFWRDPRVVVHLS